MDTSSPRKPLEIICSCVATILATSWVAVHSNLSHPIDSKFKNTLHNSTSRHFFVSHFLSLNGHAWYIPRPWRPSVCLAVIIRADSIFFIWIARTDCLLRTTLVALSYFKTNLKMSGTLQYTKLKMSGTLQYILAAWRHCRLSIPIIINGY